MLFDEGGGNMTPPFPGTLSRGEGRGNEERG